MKSFSNETLNFFLQKVLGLLHFGSSQNWKLWNKRVLSTGEPCTCEYVTLLQSFHTSTFNSNSSTFNLNQRPRAYRAHALNN